MKSTLNTIRKRKWFLGNRRDESLLFYSMKTKGEEKYLPKFGLPYVDRLLVSDKNNQPIRALDDDIASKLHGIMRNRVLKNPVILSDFVKRDRITLRKLIIFSEKLNQSYKKNTEKSNLKLFGKAWDLYALHSAYVYICFAAGVQLTKNLDQAKNKVIAKKALKDHDKWRNFITFPEEKFGKNIFNYLRDELSDLNIKPIRDYNYLDIEELLDYLKNHKGRDLVKDIKERKKGFVFLAFGKHFMIVTDKGFISEIKEFLSDIANTKTKTKELKGQTAFGKGKIKGKVIKILDIKKFSGNLKGKVLVAIQTTPHFIPYLMGAKAILTDEGGITCHAAIISREMNIPCIVGMKEATKKLKTNDCVEIDTDKGVVKII